MGFAWQHNYLSNLFSPLAINGMDNTARPRAIAGMSFLSASFALFFIEFPKKIPSRGSAEIIKYCGAGAMVCVFLAVTAYHDIVIIIANTPGLISMF